MMMRGRKSIRFSAATMIVAGGGICIDCVWAGDLAFNTQTLLADGEWNSPTSVAVDANGVTHIAYMTQHHTDSATKEIWYATDAPAGPPNGGDGPNQWTFTQITSNAVREEFPHLELDSAGNVHIAFHTGTTTSNKIRYVNNVGVPTGSPPGTFNPIIDITASGFKIVKHDIDSKGTVHFVFTSQTSNFTDEVFYVTWNAESGLGPQMNLSMSPGSESNPHIAIDTNDNVHIAWADGAFAGPLVYMNNVGGPLSVKPTGVTATNAESPMILISNTNVANIVYRTGDFLFAIDDGGTGTFTAPIPVYSGSYRPSFYNKFAIDENGMRYIAFASNVGDNKGIFFVPETENGFATPVQLSQTQSGNQGASLSVNASGKLVVTYQTSGSNPKNGTVFANIFVAETNINPVNCPADIAPQGPPVGNGIVDVDDLLAVINAWGPCPNCELIVCVADIAPEGPPAGNCVVDVDDLLAVINAWGPCDS